MALEDDSFAACSDGVVYSGRVPVDAHFADKSPAIDAFDLEGGFFEGLIWVGAGEGADLEEESGGEADGDGGRGAEPGADGEGGA